jgi:hypothetical protein
MDWLLALVLVVGLYYILPMIFEHRERMAQIKRNDREDTGVK